MPGLELNEDLVNSLWKLSKALPSSQVKGKGSCLKQKAGHLMVPISLLCQEEGKSWLCSPLGGGCQICMSLFCKRRCDQMNFKIFSSSSNSNRNKYLQAFVTGYGVYSYFSLLGKNCYLYHLGWVLFIPLSYVSLYFVIFVCAVWCFILFYNWDFNFIMGSTVIFLLTAKIHTSSKTV